MSILRKYNDGSGHYFILKTYNMVDSFQVLNNGIQLLRENNINVGCLIPDPLVIELYYTGKAYIKDRAKHLGSLNDLLLIAARDGDIKTVEQLIERGAKINDNDDIALLMAAIAARDGHIKTVKQLIEKLAKIKDISKTALAKAAIVAELCHIKTVEQLNEKLAMINDVGNTALLMAAYNGHTEIVKLLIEKGVNINARNIYGWTTLDCAQKKGHKNIVDWLKEKGGKFGGPIVLSPRACLFP